ncbi:MAG TPA: hypothetical protein VGA55_07835 [Bacteroidota bacterium]
MPLPFTDWRFLSIAGAFLLLSLLALNDVLVYTPDSARYLVWAESLARFRGFEDLSIPEPFHYVVHAPLYSLLLAPMALLAPKSVLLAKVLTALFGVGLLATFYAWLAGLTSRGVALAGTLVLAFHPLTILFSNQILSDIPFAASVVLLFILADRLYAAPQGDSRLTWAIPLTLTAAVFLREVGITLLLGLTVFLLARKDFRRAAIAFAVPFVFYLAWFVRNEVIVAGAEHPPLRNSEIFTLHYFTEQTASLIQELIARLQVNLPVYLDHVSRLVFLSQYGTSPYGVLVTSQPPVSSAAAIASVLTVPLALLSAGLAVYGIVVSAKRRPSSGLFLAFIPLYLLLILFYPFNDVRFVYPILIFMIAYGAVGAGVLMGKVREKSRPTILAAAGTLTAVFLVPNGAWCYAFVRDNLAYRQSPPDFYASVAELRPFPDMLTKPMTSVGEWITAHHPEPVIVLTQWKELTFWLPNGKLVEVNTLVPLDELERFIRDYQVSYVVSAVGLAGIPEFFPQMTFSRRYDFESVYRTANLEVFKVSEEDGEASLDMRAANELRFRFADALNLLEGGRADSARQILTELSDSTKGGSVLTLYLAIAYEFEGRFEAAKELLLRLQTMKQAGPFLGHAKFHREIIGLLEQAGREQRPAARAELLHVASVKYWNLGFHNRSLNLLDYSLQADPRFPPSLTFGCYYNLELKRGRLAREYFQRLSQAAPGHPMIDRFSLILAHRDSARGGPNDPHRLIETAKAFRDAGLGDSAIDELLTLLRHDSQNTIALQMLADLYVSKRRYYPALKSAERLLKVNPTDQRALESLEDLLQRW